MIKGLDLLGLGSPHWDIRGTLAAFPQGFALGCFDGGHGSWNGSFGDPRANVEKLLQTGRAPTVRVHLFWSSVHMLAPEGIIKVRAPLWEALAKKYPAVKFYLSPSCEYKTGDVHAVQHLVNLLSQLAPSCTCVLTPMPPSPSIQGIMNEEHGSHATTSAGQIASTDGQSLYDLDAPVWTRRNQADICFAWGMRCNLAESGVTLPPDQRTASPNADYITGLARLFDDPGVIPVAKFPGHVTPFAKPYLYKTFGEDMPGQQSRDNKPLIIVDAAAPNAEVLTCDGTKLGTFPIFGKPGDYPGKLTRFYSGLPGGMNLMGWQIGDKAKQVSGYPYVWFRVGNKYYGPVHGSFRAGFFQA